MYSLYNNFYYSSSSFLNVFSSFQHFSKLVSNLTICKSDKHKERWYLFTNRDPKRARKIMHIDLVPLKPFSKMKNLTDFTLKKPV